MLRINGVEVYYGDVQVLFDIGLDVNEKEFVSIVGANAAGKSTLLRALSGLLKRASGSIEFKGEQILGKPPYEIVSKGIVHIPEGRRVFPLMSVQENLEVGAYTHRSQREMSQALKEAYELFPTLAERKSQIAGSLSGGEQQMLSIARGLMSQPTLLTVDEPSLGLAPLMVRKTFQVLQSINAENVTVLLVEQNVVNALSMSDQAYVLENGRIVLKGTGADLLKNRHLKKAYMGI